MTNGIEDGVKKDANERDFTDNVVETYQTYDQLVSSIIKSGKDYDMAAIEKAYLFANKAHAGQKRKSGEPYIVHPVSVANILVSLGMDTESVVAALLHDVVEDTPVTLEDIRSNFGDTTAQIIDGLTKLSKLGFNTEEEHQAENVRRMLIATNKDIRVLIIKLADRLNNMRTLSAMYPQKQRNIARETLEIYAPLLTEWEYVRSRRSLRISRSDILTPLATSRYATDCPRSNRTARHFLKA